jgi:hypothetical protein
MGLQVQSNAELLYGLTFAIIFAISIVVVFGLYRLGTLPGRIARFRGHPRANSISVCGWLGLLRETSEQIATLKARLEVPPKRAA